jgi:hypothetical protein
MKYHGVPKKKIWYTVLFQKKNVEKGTTTPKNRKENLFFMLMYPPTPTKSLLLIHNIPSNVQSHFYF